MCTSFIDFLTLSFVDVKLLTISIILSRINFKDGRIPLNYYSSIRVTRVVQKIELFLTNTYNFGHIIMMIVHQITNGDLSVIVE